MIVPLQKITDQPILTDDQVVAMLGPHGEALIERSRRAMEDTLRGDGRAERALFGRFSRGNCPRFIDPDMASLWLEGWDREDSRLAELERSR